MTVQKVNYRGRKGLIGKVCFSDQGLGFFAGYHECECGNRGKILLNVDEAREFAQKVGGGGMKVPIGAKLARKLSAHYGV